MSYKKVSSKNITNCFKETKELLNKVIHFSSDFVRYFGEFRIRQCIKEIYTLFGNINL